MRFSGTGFTYGPQDVPTGGTITQILIYDSADNLVLTIDQISGSGPARDLGQIAANMFGWYLEPGSIGPDGKMTWSHLLMGNDTIIGTAGDDRQLPGYMGGNDFFKMRGGDDYIWCGAGKDTISGGSGFDVLSYGETAFNEAISAARGISVNMIQKTVIDNWGFTDTFTGIESVHGSRFNDSFLGSSAEDEFAGLRGRDTLNGGAGRDTAYYSDEQFFGAIQGIVVDLDNSIQNGVIRGSAVDSFGHRDILINMENVRGTGFDDNITGSRLSNNLRGGDGDDTLTGGRGQDQFQSVFNPNWAMMT